MKTIIESIENSTMRKYGLESQRTLVVCRLTETVRNIFHIEY